MNLLQLGKRLIFLPIGLFNLLFGIPQLQLIIDTFTHLNQNTIDDLDPLALKPSAVKEKGKRLSFMILQGQKHLFDMTI
ncbi:hypothetical protein D3C76_1748010 [compost metagenome]